MDTAKLYWSILRDYPIDQVEAGLRHVVKTVSGTYGRDLPPVADIVTAIEGTVDNRALLAYDKFQEHMSRYGTTKSVAYDDPVIHSVIKHLGGVQAAGQMLNNEWTKKAFIEAYRACVCLPKHPAYIVGTCEADNGDRVHDEYWRDKIADQIRIRFIGDAAKARMLLENGTKQITKEG